MSIPVPLTKSASISLRYRWVILGICWFAFAIAFMQRVSVAPLAPFIKEDLTLTGAQIGFFMSSASFGSIVTAVPAGWLADRIGVRWLFLIGGLIGGSFLASMVWVTTFTHGVITMALAGTGMGCISPSTTKAILEWFPPRERATAMGFKQTGLNIGGIVGAAALPLIALAVSWQYGFLAIGMLVIVIGIASFVLYREPPQGAGLQSSGPVLIPRKRPSALEVLRSKDIWLLFLAGTALVIIEFAAIAYFVLYFEESLLFDVVIAGIFLAIANGSGGFGKPLSGLISDLFFHGKRKTVFILMCGTILALCLVFAFLWPGSPVWLVVILSIIFGFVATGWAGIHLTLVGEFAGKELTGTASGVMSPFMAAGNIIGPPAFGYIVDSTGSYQMGWWFLAAVALIATVLVFFVREERKKI